jgi:hypothetical protein
MAWHVWERDGLAWRLDKCALLSLHCPSLAQPPACLPAHWPNCLPACKPARRLTRPPARPLTCLPPAVPHPSPPCPALQVFGAVVRHVDWEVVRCLVIAGPGFAKDHFREYLDKGGCPVLPCTALYCHVLCCDRLAKDLLRECLHEGGCGSVLGAVWWEAECWFARWPGCCCC